MPAGRHGLREIPCKEGNALGARTEAVQPVDHRITAITLLVVAGGKIDVVADVTADGGAAELLEADPLGIDRFGDPDGLSLSQNASGPSCRARRGEGDRHGSLQGEQAGEQQPMES